MKDLKEYRMKSGLKSWEIARRMGVSRQTLTNYERGRVKMTIDVLKKFATIYNVSVIELLDGE